ncbi:MAG TPA: DUF5916 domain-containing protein [Pyrinomonadaceae bacterium]|jgi:hypothetical protein
MKALCAFITALFLTVYVPAQAANLTPEASETEKPKETKTIPAKKSGVVVPPEKARPISIPKIEAAPVIDGKPDEENWKRAAVFKDFYQTSPGDNTEPSRPTEVMVMYDEKHLYVAFKCWDEKDKVRATVAKRDEVTGEDNVRLWLDTYNDQRRAYVLAFNPLGIQQDGIYTEGQGADFSVDIVMESKGVIEDWGWSVEVKIPFKSLRYTAGKGKMWGFNAARNIDRFNDEFDQWLPDDRNVSGFLVKHGKITGLDEIKTERTLEIVPSVTISETGSRKRTIPTAGFTPLGGYDPVFNPYGLRDPGRFVNDPVKTEIGVNLKYTITPNVTLDAAINPDFAEIEADAPVVTANQRFPIFFQEKRPFFLEGKEIFDSPLQPFYSRTIVDPDFAAKLTGKVGKTSFGFLAASDNAPGNYSEDERTELAICQEKRLSDPTQNCSIEEFVDQNALFGVLRVKRDFGANNNVGFFATARVFPKNRNFVGGFDGKFKFGPSTTMTFQVLGTHSRKNFFDPYYFFKDDRPANPTNYRTGNGFGYYWNLDYTKDTHGWFIEAIGRTGDYRADSGFTQRTDTHTVFLFNRFSTKSKPKAKIIRFDWQQFGRYRVDGKGRFTNGFVGTGGNLALQGSLFVSFESGLQKEKIYENEFGFVRNPAAGAAGAFFGDETRSATQPYFSVNFNKNFSKRFAAYGFVGSIINAFDYDFGAGGRFLRVSPAYRAYLGSPAYLDYLVALRNWQTNPVGDRPEAPGEPGLDPGSGWQFDTNLGFEYKPTDPLRVSLDYTKSRLKRNDNGETAFDTNIFSLRSTYQFSRFAYTRLRLDYDTLSRSVGGQFLFGWNPNPGTAFYVGYNDNFNYNGFSPITGQLEPRFERNSRTFFIRASYLFRKSF